MEKGHYGQRTVDISKIIVKAWMCSECHAKSTASPICAIYYFSKDAIDGITPGRYEEIASEYRK